MGVGPFSSESRSKSQTDTTSQTTTGSGIAQSVKGGGRVVGPSSVGGNLSQQEVQGNLLRTDKGNITVTSGVDVTTLKDILAQQSSGASEVTSTLSDIFNKTLEQVAARAESQETGGDSERNKIILYVVLGLFAVLAVYFWRRR
jgi:hypothetical protein